MLPSAHRLAKVRDFNLLAKQGYFVRGGFISLKVLQLAKKQTYFPKKEDPDKFKNQLKLAFAVGTKISKKAAERNRLKRQLREVVRLLLKDGAVRSGYYVLIMPTVAAINKNYSELSQEIKLVFHRAGIMKSGKNG